MKQNCHFVAFHPNTAWHHVRDEDAEAINFTFITEIRQYVSFNFFRLTWCLRLMQLCELHQSNLSILALFMMLISFNVARKMISPALNPAYLAMICLLFHKTAEIAASGNSIRPELLQKPEMWAATLRSGTRLNSALVFKTEKAT